MSRVQVAAAAMGTRFEVVLHDARRSEADLRAVAEAALAEVAAWERLLSAFRPDSELYRVNQYAAKKPVRVDGRLMGFLARSRELSVATHGAFDPTVGPLLRAWGFSGGGGGAAPTAAVVSAARELVGMAEHVRLDGEASTVAFDRPGVRLDPGALGKGYALEEAARLPTEEGIDGGLLHGGTSSVVAFGTDETGDPRGWGVAIRSAEQGSPGREIRLRDTALSVSAPHGRVVSGPSGEWGHVIDPRSGLPVPRGQVATAVCASAAEAEALSTALLVRGDAGLELLSERFPAARLWLERAAENPR